MLYCRKYRLYTHIFSWNFSRKVDNEKKYVPHVHIEMIWGSWTRSKTMTSRKICVSFGCCRKGRMCTSVMMTRKMKKEWKKKLNKSNFLILLYATIATDSCPFMPEQGLLFCYPFSLSLFTYNVNVTYAFVSYVSRKMFYHCFSHKFSHERHRCWILQQKYG